MSPHPFPNETALLVRIAAKDQLAFRLIYDRYRKRIYTLSLRLLKSTELAEETVQETFLKIWLMGPELKKINNLEPYLLTLSRNKALDLLRSREREAKNDRIRTQNWSESHNETEEAILLQDTNALLKQGIEQLPPQQKKVYQLCQQQGLKYEEAAVELNLSPLTVKTHMQQALRFLRRYMSSHADLGLVLVIFTLENFTDRFL